MTHPGDAAHPGDDFRVRATHSQIADNPQATALGIGEHSFCSIAPERDGAVDVSFGRDAVNGITKSRTKKKGPGWLGHGSPADE